jgi:hypothetical protein
VVVDCCLAIAIALQFAEGARLVPRTPPENISQLCVALLGTGDAAHFLLISIVACGW